MLSVFALVICLGSTACQITYTGYVYNNLCLASATGVAIDGTKVKAEAHLLSAGCMTLAYNLSSSSWPYVITWLSSLLQSRKNLAATVTGSLDTSGALVLAS